VSGELLPSTDKSKLMAILEELPNKTGGDQQPEDVANETAPLPPRKVTVMDGMAVVQAMGKPALGQDMYPVGRSLHSHTGQQMQ